MFTGIVEESGTVTGVSRNPDGGVRLALRSALDLTDTKDGDSISVDGCCLTVVRIERAPDATLVSFDLGPETLKVTTLGELAAGDRVHLERAVRVSDRLGGHLVAGHVDAMGSVEWTRKENDALIVRFKAPRAITRYTIQKGSVCVDGVSLTVNAVDDGGFEVGLIPHTLVVTHFAQLQPGDRVNLEADLIGKYVEKLLVGRIPPT